jgi:hypothetical protein
MKTVTIHQPNYLPWLGFFSKISHSDCFIIFDNAEYTKNSVTNRNKIRTKDGWGYLTIPIDRKFYGTEIHEVTLPRDKNWMETHWKTIKQNYTKSDFFNLHQDFFESLYHGDFGYLWQINEKVISYLLRCFETDVEVIKASELNVDPNLRKTDMLIACLRGVGADIYLSGPSGRDYLDFEKFAQNNIELKFFEFQHPVYKQTYSGFEPAMAAVDLLFNVGPQASEIIKASGSISNSLRVGS